MKKLTGKGLFAIWFVVFGATGLVLRYYDENNNIEMINLLTWVMVAEFFIGEELLFGLVWKTFAKIGKLLKGK